MIRLVKISKKKIIKIVNNYTLQKKKGCLIYRAAFFYIRYFNDLHSKCVFCVGRGKQINHQS
jgi:hypothetical protein